MSDALYFRILGELDVLRRSERIPVAGAKLPVLLVTLLLRANQTVSVDELVDRLWGDTPPGRARGSLPTYVMRLRQALGDNTKSPTLIRTRAGGYAIEIMPDQLDLLRFRTLVERGELAAALALWSGEALTGIQSESLHRYEVPRLTEEHLRVLERRIDLDLETGQVAELAGELSELTARYPMRERFWGQRMLALLRSGRQADALACYHTIRDRLIEELGVEPGPELRRVHDTVLRNDTRLEPSNVRAIPRQLPADVTSFAGRHTALAQLDARVTARTVMISAIHGTAGIGKTALAVHWAHRVSGRFPDGQLYLDLRGFDPDRPPVDPGDALGRFLRALGTEQVPPDLEERSAQFRSLVAGRKLLVLLDNAATADQVRPLLPGSPGCLVLVTSRNQLTGLVALDGARDLTLDVLTAAEAMSLLEAVVGRTRVRAEPDAAAELVELCGRLPLALRIVAGKLVMRPTQPVASAAAELRDGARLGALEVEGDRRGAVRAAFDMSYLGVKPDEQRLFRRLSLVPGPDFTVAAAAVLADLAEPATTRLLDRLVAGHLIECSAPQRFRLHDLLRHYARERCDTEESTKDISAAVSRLFDWYLSTARATVRPALGGTAPAWAWFEDERANLAAAVADAIDRGLLTTTVRLAGTLRGFFTARGYFDGDWRAIVHNGLAAAGKLGDDRATAAMYLDQAIAHYALGDLHGYLDQSRLAHEFAGKADWVNGVAKALTHLGQGHLELGMLPEAFEFLERSQALMSEADSLPELSVSHVVTGFAHLDRGELRAAAGHFGKALTMARTLNSLPTEVAALHGLGTTELQLGEEADALASFTECLRVSRLLGNRDRAALSLGHLAELAGRSGDPSSAGELLGQAVAVVDAGTTYHWIGPTVRNAAGRISVLLGKADAAIGYHRQALETARRIGYPYYETEALLGLADAHRHLGKLDDARTLAEQALIIAERAGFQVLARTTRNLLTLLQR
jgi:DNA-binding SARP family transcriptional activator/tetratricopeptide (TPR) repeat protein